NSYALAAGPTTGTVAMAGWRQELWYAKNVAGASSLNVTATFTGAFNSRRTISVHEYSGLDPIAPLDRALGSATSSANASTGTVTTRFATELVFAAALFHTSGSAGPGFTQRSSIASNVSEDKAVTAAGSYAGQFSNNAQAAIVHIATFKAAGQ